MLDSEVNREFIERIDESKRSSIRKMLNDSTFAVPTVASFTMSYLGDDEPLTGTYSSNA